MWEYVVHEVTWQNKETQMLKQYSVAAEDKFSQMGLLTPGPNDQLWFTGGGNENNGESMVSFFFKGDRFRRARSSRQRA